MSTVHYDTSMPLKEKIFYVLSAMEKASANEISTEIMELDGISTEDGVEEITIDVENEIEKLCDQGTVNKLKEHRQKVRYILNKETIS